MLALTYGFEISQHLFEIVLAGGHEIASNAIEAATDSLRDAAQDTATRKHGFDRFAGKLVIRLRDNMARIPIRPNACPHLAFDITMKVKRDLVGTLISFHMVRDGEIEWRDAGNPYGICGAVIIIAVRLYIVDLGDELRQAPGISENRANLFLRGVDIYLF